MKTENTSIYYIIPALICGIATACVVTGSAVHMVLGAVLGLLSAGFWMNVVVQKDGES
jgi:hypothetical protein